MEHRDSLAIYGAWALFFDLSESGKQAMLALLELSKKEQGELLNPQGYNIGINDGTGVGQTAPHCHPHLTRVTTLDNDPRDGMHCVVPEKADYWSGFNA